MTLDLNIFLRTTMLSCQVRKIMRVMTTKVYMYMFYFIINIVVVPFLYLYFTNYIIFYSSCDRGNVNLIITNI
jgi:hypothetical protein